MNFYRQNFSFPERTIIYYIAKNPSSPKLYQKLIKTCKYFYLRNQILSLHCLQYQKDEWFTCSKIGEKSCGKMTGKLCYGKERIFLNSVSQKIWVTNYFSLSKASTSKLQKKFQLCAVTFNTWEQTISYDQLKLFGTCVKTLNFHTVIIKKEDGSNASLTEIVKCFPLLENFTFIGNISSYISSSNFNELSKILLSSNIKIFEFEFDSVSEEFKIEEFYQLFLKKNKTMDVRIWFDRNISETFKQKLSVIIEEILESKTNDFFPPYISTSNYEMDIKISNFRRIYNEQK